jgi:glycyl-tRNA synthetase beta subunit
MQAGARADLEKLFVKELAAAGLKAGSITVWSTPRRLALIARDLPLATQAVSEEVKGPRASAPPQALEGFLRKTGLTREQLTERDGVLFAVTEKPGRATAACWPKPSPPSCALPLAQVAALGRGLVQPGALRWVRPLSGIIAILGERRSISKWGHPFGHGHAWPPFPPHGDVVITDAADYAAALRDAFVIVDHAEREAPVRDKARAAAQDAGLVLVDDEGLVVENAGLTEWPVPLLGRFDEAFLDVPPETIQLTARVNQKYFICRDAAASSPMLSSAPPTSRRAMAARRSWRATARCWPRACPTPASSGSRTRRCRWPFRPKSWRGSPSTKSWAPWPTRSPAWRTWPNGSPAKAWCPAPIRRWRVRPRNCARPISSPTWSANSRNCRA